ncbi:DNA-damage-inducible protein F [Granulosicoccus antarcticus IMCC3135]|uniref:DNA-damage-inducible protein F n=2 Tax=Granulosicoccus TaxID=437504 RepID=A0A2Z2NXQ6_9GAMM|nr:DNA-damage-inducible protein F [Granulosicoccus antarcticus IMCC3135]
MLSNSMVPIVGIVDTAVMGHMGSPEWIAATAVGALLFSSIFWLFGFLRMGTGGLVAQAFGADNHTEAGRIAVRAMSMAALLGILLILLQSPLLELGLAALTDSQDWKALTSIYFSIRIYSAPATLMIYVIMGTLIGLQLMRQVLFLQLALNVLNVILTIGFFSLTDLNIAGVALATVISEYTTLALGLYLSRDVLLQALRQKPISPWLFDSQECLKFFRISGNLFIRTLCLILAMYWMTVMGSRIGVATLAANTILLNMVSFTAYSLDGYAHAIETLTGYSLGQRNQAMFKRATRASIELAALTAIVFSGIFWLFGHTLAGLMTNDAQIVAMATQWLPWVILVPLTGVWSFLLDGIFIGATQTANMRDSMIVSLLVFGVSTLVTVPLLGNHGIWLSYHIMLVTRALTLARYWPQVVHRMSASVHTQAVTARISIP